MLNNPKGSETDMPPFMLQVEGKCWAVPESVLHSTLFPLQGRDLGPLLADLDLEAARPAKGPKMYGNGVARVDLTGPITPKGSFLDLLFGGSGGLQTFISDLQAALANPDVGSVVLNIDSPGGLVDMVPEVAAQMRSLRSDTSKPIVAVANTVAASAAYWLASQAHEITVTPSGEVGSVGVYMMHRDISAALDQAGIKPTFVKAGAHKTEGNPYEPLSTDAASAMQEQVNDYYDMFVKDVAQGRGVEAPDTSDGMAFGGARMFSAQRAVKAGLADRVATLDQTITRLSSGRARVRRLEADGHDQFEVVADGSKEREVAYSRDDKIRMVDTLAGLTR